MPQRDGRSRQRAPTRGHRERLPPARRQRRRQRHWTPAARPAGREVCRLRLLPRRLRVRLTDDRHVPGGRGAEARSVLRAGPSQPRYRRSVRDPGGRGLRLRPPSAHVLPHPDQVGIGIAALLRAGSAGPLYVRVAVRAPLPNSRRAGAGAEEGDTLAILGARPRLPRQATGWPERRAFGSSIGRAWRASGSTSGPSFWPPDWLVSPCAACSHQSPQRRTCGA